MTRIFIKSIVFAFFGLLLAITAFAEETFTGKVISVIDGNTIEILTNEKETLRIMFHGIDCPELDQQFGDKAKRYLEKLILEKEVDVKIYGKDRWGNKLAVVLVENKIDPRINLLKEGLAWTAERNPQEDLEELKQKAQEKGKGLWKEESPTPPWIYRRQQTMLQPKSSE